MKLLALSSSILTKLAATCAAVISPLVVISPELEKRIPPVVPLRARVWPFMLMVLSSVSVWSALPRLVLEDAAQLKIPVLSVTNTSPLVPGVPGRVRV